MNKQPEILTDDQIILNLQQGRDMETSIKYLYRLHYEVLSLYVINNNGSAADAEDTFQEVIIAFIHLVKNGKFRGEAGIRTFLYAMNRNTWLNELKKRGRAEARELKYEMGNQELDQSIDRVIANRETEKILVDTMDQVGDTCKQILLLFYYENRSMKEILTSLHYENEQVVRNKKYKCLKKLEELVTSNKTLFQQLKTYLNG